MIVQVVFEVVEMVKAVLVYRAEVAMVIASCLLLKVPQSVEERKPGWFAVAVAIVQVRVEPLAEMESPVFPEVAKVYAVWERVVPAAEMVVVVNPVRVCQETPPTAVEDAMRTVPFVPTALAIHPLVEATIMLPVEVAMAAM